MPPYVLSPIATDEAERVGEIQQAAFADDPLTHAALAAVPRAAYIRWCADAFRRPAPPPGHRAEYVAARDSATGEIGGWAWWTIPLQAGEAAPVPAEEVPLPDAIDARVWGEFFAGLTEHKTRLMGDRPRWRACAARARRARHSRRLRQCSRSS
jgi:hypothetical protein